MSPALLAAVGGVFLAAVLCAALWLAARTGDPDLERRLLQASAPLRRGARAGAGEAAASVFRRRRARSRLREWIDRRFVMLEGRRAFAKVAALGLAAAAGVSAAAAFMQLGSFVPLLAPAAWLAGSWGCLSMWDTRTRAAFVKHFPEIVDHVVRLTRAGLPAVEALSVVSEEAPEPVRGVLRKISDEITSGLDPEAVLRGAAGRLRIPEFTLFSAALCMQRTTGGGISTALGNLSATLRARLELEMKAHAATAQTRITLWVLTAVPLVVMAAQSFTNPQAMEMLLETDAGATLLRWSVALILLGLLIARGIAARFGR